MPPSKTSSVGKTPTSSNILLASTTTFHNKPPVDKKKFSCKVCCQKIFSIKVALIVIFAAQILLPSTIILISTLIQTDAFINQQVTAYAQQVNLRTLDFMRSTLDAPFGFTTNMANIVTKGIINDYEVIKAKDYLVPLKQRYPNLSFIYYITNNNIFVGVNSLLGSPILEVSIGGLDVIFDVNKENTDVIGFEFPLNPAAPTASDYQPFTDDWFLEVMADPVNRLDKWDSVFYYYDPVYDKENIMISAYSAIYNISNPTQYIGWAGADFQVTDISKYLATLPLSEHSLLYIIERDTGYIVAGSSQTDIYFNSTDPDGPGFRIPMQNSKIPAISHVGKMLIENDWMKEDNLVKLVSLDGVEYLIQLTAFNDNHGLDWSVIILFAMDDYKTLTVTFRNTVISVNVVIVILNMFFGLILALIITRPLVALGMQMEKLRQLRTSSKNLMVAAHKRKVIDKPDEVNFEEKYKDFQVSIEDDIKKKKASFLANCCNFQFEEVSALQNNFQNLKQAVMGFSKYVPVEIVSTLVSSSDSQQLLKPFFQTNVITLMFTDIQDFTTISEQLEPMTLVTMLSQYFEETSTIIQQNEGTLDKYIGDAIMCFFNSPQEVLCHEQKACLTAIKMQKVVNKLNAYFASKQLPALHTRIGIHTGQALVGNCGSSARLNYTALGDAVNLASRLEAVNKDYGTKILISHDTAKAIQSNLVLADSNMDDIAPVVVENPFTLRLIDKVAVKGKKNAISVYHLMNISDQSDAEELALANSFSFIMNELYFKQQFPEAYKMLDELQQRYPNDKATKLMMERCLKFIKSPPNNWNGVYVKHSK